MRKLAWCLVVAWFVLGACKGRETPAPPAPATTTQVVETGPVAGGRLVRRLETDVDSLNFVLHSTEDERQVLQYLYDPMIDFDANLEPIPGTVAKWEIEDGGKAYVLHIDPRAKFSDGAPVTAADVIFTLEKIIDEQSVQFAAWFDGLDREQTKAIDEKTARVVFKEPRVTQLIAFNIGVMPKHVYGKGDFQKNKAVIGNGPYVLERRETGKTISLKRNENYWRDKPYIDSVLFRVIADDNVAWNALKRGDVHVARVNNDTWAREKDTVKDRFEFHNIYPLSFNCAPWNIKDPLFKDASVRRGLAMAFDRQTVIDRLYHGEARALSGPFTPDSWAYNAEVLPVEFNLQGAAALLASAGWKDSDQDGTLDRDGKPFEFTMLVSAGNKPSADQSQIYQDALKSIGVKMEIATLDGAAFFDRILKGNYQSAMMSWSIDPDPDPYSLFHSSQTPPAGLNIVHYKNAEVDRLLDRGRTTFERTRRTEIYHHLHDIIASDQPYLFMVQVGYKWAVDKRVKNVRTGKGLGLFLWRPGPYDWWLAKE
ncbi:MAG TPA: ABC transporter substrate-binding protein [Thermoanaerobaculia bacterium]|jgi:peptide/nickel transport system substrate-binding protein|nr:ABC transporter substrate-binding protein [Thermoanaerobaculia bacterium]